MVSHPPCFFPGKEKQEQKTGFFCSCFLMLSSLDRGTSTFLLGFVR